MSSFVCFVTSLPGCMVA